MLVGCLPALWAYVRRRVDDLDTTDEILQEVSLRALGGGGPRQAGAFFAWTCGIARHVIGLEWRRRRRLRAEQPLEPLSLEDIRDPLATPDRLYDARVSLERALAADAPRAALLLKRHLDDVSCVELARQAGVSPPALRMRLMRMRAVARARTKES